MNDKIKAICSIPLCLLFLLFFICSLAAQVNNSKIVEEIWVGNLVIPNAADLRVRFHLYFHRQSFEKYMKYHSL